jgi:ribosomal protein S18 acetylase RimI-like enzyme
MTHPPREHRRGEFTISTDRSRLDLTAIHAFVSTSYWAAGIPLEVVRRSINHSLCFGVYKGERQVGFARAITDQATFAYLADVYILEEYRGRGLARWLLECILGDPALQGLRRFTLVTRDAHDLYRKLGFREVAEPSTYMEILVRNPYRRAQH